MAFAQSLLGGAKCMGCGARLGTVNSLEGGEAYAVSMLERKRQLSVARCSGPCLSPSTPRWRQDREVILGYNVSSRPTWTTQVCVKKKGGAVREGVGVHKGLGLPHFGFYDDKSPEVLCLHWYFGAT